MAFANTSRRTFRGRGRASDGNIPNGLARRNRAARQADRERSNRLANNRRVDQELADGAAGDDESDADSAPTEQEQIRSHESTQEDEEAVKVVIHGLDEVKQEIAHLNKRIRNVQESIQLSDAIANPTTWEQNCLNAVSNCVDEWRSIVSFHCQSNAGNNDSDGNMNAFVDIGRDTSLAVFGLVQMALQSGPLTGSNPGYFKRCGGEVARTALEFLRSQSLSGDLAQSLLFSDKQISAIEKWTKNAEKAADYNKPPSKSMVKLQEGKGKSKRKKGKASRISI